MKAGVICLDRMVVEQALTYCGYEVFLSDYGSDVKNGNKVYFGNKVTIYLNVRSMQGVTVYDHVPECHVTFGRGGLHYV